MPIDPGARRVLDLLRELGRPPMHTLSPADARVSSAKSRAVLGAEPPEVAEIETLVGDGVTMRRYRGIGTDPAAALPCLLFLHGGAWVIGDLDSHDQICRSLANHAACCVISVDYRLAPEHRYPAAVDDAAIALHHVHAHAAALRIDPTRLAVGGDSAGGNLAAVLCLMARDGVGPTDGGAPPPMPTQQVLLYPAVDLGGNTPSYGRFTEGLILTTATMHWFIDHYLGPDREARHDWRASPLRARTLAGLPPAFVMTAGNDPLLDEGIAYARRLDEEGVHVAYLHMADQIHAYLTMGRFVPAAGLTIRHTADWLARQWSTPS